MKTTTLLSCIVLVLLPMQQHSSGWRGIVPFHSTRADVERLLGASSDECRCLYKGEYENVQIEYSTERCGKGERNELDVPPDTVLTVAVYLKRKPLWSELGLDSTRFEKTEDPERRGYLAYTSYQEGVTYNLAYDGKVFEIRYFGTLKDRNDLRCPLKESAPKLELAATVLNSAYCSESNLRLTLQLSFQNTGSQAILLRKDGFRVGRYKVSPSAEQLKAGKYEVNAAPMMNSIAILQNRLEGTNRTDEAFLTIEPGSTHKVLIELNIPFIEQAEQRSQHSLAPGDHLLELLVWTWLDSESFARQLREKSMERGYLWTKSLVSQPIPFSVPKAKVISTCS